MFIQLSNLMREAELLGVNVTLKPIQENKISLVLSFLTNPVLDSRIYNEHNANNTALDSVIALQSALATPIVLQGLPEELGGLLEQAITTIKLNLTEAVKTQSTINLSELLKATAATATKAKPNSDSKKQKAATKSAAKSDTAPAKTEQPEQKPVSVVDFEQFDSL